MHRQLFLLVALSGLLLSGCITEQKAFVHADYYKRVPHSVAVLPPIDTSGVEAAPQLCQWLLASKLSHSWYFYGRCLSVPATVEFLRSKNLYSGGRFGRTDGQKWIWTPSPKPETLCQDLGVNGLFVGLIEEFSYQEAVIARARKVTVLWMLTDNTGLTIWRARGTGQSFQASKNLEEGWKATKANLVYRAAEEVAKAPLYPEALQATEACVRGLPRSRWSTPIKRAPRIPNWP